MLLTGAADAEAPSAFVVVDDPDSSLAFRMRAELEAQGLRVEVRRADQLQADPLSKAVHGARAVVIVRVAGRGESVEILVLDLAAGRIIQHTLPPAQEQGAPGSEIVVLRTVELVRTSLMEREAPRPSRPEVPAPAKSAAIVPRPAPASAPPEPRQWSLAVGPTVLMSAPADSGWAVRLDLDWWAARAPFGVALGTRLPLVPARVSRSEGVADIRHAAFWLAATARLSPERARWWAGAGLGLSLDFLSVVGTSARPDEFEGFDSGTKLGVSPLADLQMALRLADHVSLRATGTVGCLRPATKLRFGGREVGEYGCPWGAVGTALSVSWP